MKREILFLTLILILFFVGCSPKYSKEGTSVSINVIPQESEKEVGTTEDKTEIKTETEQQVKVPQATVIIQAFRYYPQTLRIVPGTNVTWINKDGVKHSVKWTSGPQKFYSGDILPGESYSFLFDGEGIFEYRCEDHNGMRGKIVSSTVSKEANVIIVKTE